MQKKSINEFSQITVQCDNDGEVVASHCIPVWRSNHDSVCPSAWCAPHTKPAPAAAHTQHILYSSYHCARCRLMHEEFSMNAVFHAHSQRNTAPYHQYIEGNMRESNGRMNSSSSSTYTHHCIVIIFNGFRALNVYSYVYGFFEWYMDWGEEEVCGGGDGSAMMSHKTHTFAYSLTLYFF